MILYLSKNRNILAYSKTKTEEQENAEISKGIAVRYEGDFSFFMGEDIEGKRKVFYLNDDNTIRIEYIDIPIDPIPEPTQLDRIEAAVNAKNEEIAQASIDNYTLELMEGGLL